MAVHCYACFLLHLKEKSLLFFVLVCFSNLDFIFFGLLFLSPSPLFVTEPALIFGGKNFGLIEHAQWSLWLCRRSPHLFSYLLRCCKNLYLLPLSSSSKAYPTAYPCFSSDPEISWMREGPGHSTSSTGISHPGSGYFSPSRC